MSARICRNFSSRPTCTSLDNISVPSPCRLKLVGHDDRELRLGAGSFDSRPSGNDLVFAGLRILAVDHQRHRPVVVDEAESRQALVRHPLAQVQHVEVAEIDAPLREGRVELDEQRFIFRSNRSDRHLGSVLHGPGRDVLHGVRTNRQLRQLALRSRRVVQDDPRVERNQPLGRRDQRVDVDLLDPALFHHEIAEPDQQLLQRLRSTGLRPRTPLRAVKIRVRSIIRGPAWC